MPVCPATSIRWRTKCGVIILKVQSVHARDGVARLSGQGSGEGRSASTAPCLRSSSQCSLALSSFLRPQSLLCSATQVILLDVRSDSSCGHHAPLSLRSSGERIELFLCICEHHSEVGVKILCRLDLVRGVPGWPFLLRFKLTQNKNIFVMIYLFRLFLSRDTCVYSAALKAAE